MDNNSSAPVVETAPLASPAPQVETPSVDAAPASAGSASSAESDTATAPAPADLDNDGHDDNSGQFVEGNDCARSVPEVEQNLIAAVEALLAAAVAFAEVPETPSFVVLDGARLQFAGHQLLMLTTA